MGNLSAFLAIAVTERKAKKILLFKLINELDGVESLITNFTGHPNFWRSDCIYQTSEP